MGHFKTFGPVQTTRFPELRYQCRGDHWRILDWRQVCKDADIAPGIGPQYPGQMQLLADLDRFAHVYGCNPEYTEPEAKRILDAVRGMIRTQQAIGDQVALHKLDALWAVVAQIRCIVTGSTGGEWPPGWD